MTVYLDDARLPYGRMVMSHLQADTLDELHAFAALLGLKREWFQPGTRPSLDHYDLAESRRAKAVRLGAVEETTKAGALRRRAARAHTA